MEPAVSPGQGPVHPREHSALWSSPTPTYRAVSHSDCAARTPAHHPLRRSCPQPTAPGVRSMNHPPTAHAKSGKPDPTNCGASSKKPTPPGSRWANPGGNDSGSPSPPTRTRSGWTNLATSYRNSPRPTHLRQDGAPPRTAEKGRFPWYECSSASPWLSALSQVTGRAVARRGARHVPQRRVSASPPASPLGRSLRIRVARLGVALRGARRLARLLRVSTVQSP